MTREELVQELRRCAELANHSKERAHKAADRALLEFIGDDVIAAAYDEVRKWYA